MTWIDGLILLVVAIIFILVIRGMRKNKDKPCATCAYAKPAQKRPKQKRDSD